jgi:hypothetical protein
MKSMVTVRASGARAPRRHLSRPTILGREALPVCFECVRAGIGSHAGWHSREADHAITPRSPWQNGHVERLIGSIRRECLDHVVVLGERHLRHLLTNYATY